MKLQWLTRCLTLFLCVCGISISSAQECVEPTSHAFLDINNVEARIGQGSVLWWDQVSLPSYQVQESGVHSVFAGGLWIAGLNKADQLHLSATTYNQTGADFRPGPIGVSVEDQQAFDHHWKVNRSTIDSFKNGLFSDIPPVILEWPGKGNTEVSFLPDQEMAPFIDVNDDGIYSAMDGDYPHILGDQSIWYVYSDGNCENTSAIDLSENPNEEQFSLGIDVHAEAFAFSTVPDLENITFYKLKIINRSFRDYHGMYISNFFDADLGFYRDDYVGTNVENRISYCYNGNAVDAEYGEDIPIVGQQILHTPIDENTGKEAPFAASVYYNNDFTVTGNPENPMDHYELMRGLWKDGTPLTEGGSWYGGDVPNPFMYPDSPSVGGGLSECANNNPVNDRRILQSVGPFELKEGASKEYYFAILWTDDVVYPCPDISPLTNLAQKVQNYFDTEILPKTFATSDGGNTAKEEVMMRVDVFPNPAKEQINISLQSASPIETIELIGIDGRVLQTLYVNGNTELLVTPTEAYSGMTLLNFYTADRELVGSERVVWE